MTILSESTAMDGASSYGLIGLLIFIILMVTACVLARYDYLKTSLIIVGLAIIIFVIVIIYGGEPHKRIKVILSDDYPATKLYEEYDVEGRDGDIWILRDKEPIKTQEDEG